MNAEYDAIVVGSGASGVSAAWPLVEAGLSVCMLDQGRRGSLHWNGDETFLERRLNDANQWLTFIGEDFSGLGAKGNESPKFKVPAHRHVLDGFREAYGIRCDGVLPTGSLALGGVTKMWRAGSYNYRGIDLKRFPFDPTELDESHRRVAARIGISGVGDDDLEPWLGADLPLQPPLPLGENARQLLMRYEQYSRERREVGVRLGRARNAVLSQPLHGRNPCVEMNMCFWGCRNGAIYGADQEILQLQKHANFRLCCGAFVTDIARTDDDAFLVRTRDLDRKLPERHFTTRTVLLAAGTIGSSILAMRHLNAFGVDIPLICHPAFATLFVLPSRIGMPLSSRGFALGQLAYLVENPDDTGDYVFGVVFSMEGLLAQDLAQHIPLSRPGAVRVAKYLMPALLVANGYLSGDHSDCSLRIDATGDVHIRGGYKPSFFSRQKDAVRKLRRLFRRLGAWGVPRGSRLAQLGSDGHFAGTLPMSAENRPLTATPECELRGARGLFLVDGAPLPFLSAKHPTFTMMANADRVARLLAKRLRNES